MQYIILIVSQHNFLKAQKLGEVVGFPFSLNFLNEISYFIKVLYLNWIVSMVKYLCIPAIDCIDPLFM